MTDQASGFSPGPGQRIRARLAGVLVILGVSYNAPLAWINAHIVPVGRNVAIGADGALILAALLFALSQWRPAMTRWLLMIASFAVLLLGLSLVRGQLAPKDFRDVLLIATFAMLGLTMPWHGARRVFVALHALILGVMLFEMAMPAAYAALFEPASYFVNTRGFREEQFYGADLFNAVRPDERYILPQTGLLRASSLFLEPVTFGNYCAFAMLMIMAFWRDFSMRARIFMVLSWAAVLVGCDSRFAGASSLLLLALWPLLKRVPVMLATVYLPLVVAATAVISSALLFNPLEDTFTGRIARGMRYLDRLDPGGLAGFTLASQQLADAGVAYMIVEQSIFGVSLLLAFLFFQPHLNAVRQRLVLNGAALILTLNLLVSNSILSLKSGAPLWFMVGAAIAADGWSGVRSDRLSPVGSPDNSPARARASPLRPR